LSNEEKTNYYEHFEKGMIYMKILKKGGVVEKRGEEETKSFRKCDIDIAMSDSMALLDPDQFLGQSWSGICVCFARWYSQIWHDMLLRFHSIIFPVSFPIIVAWPVRIFKKSLYFSRKLS
jgi:hypothetical protein